MSNHDNDSGDRRHDKLAKVLDTVGALHDGRRRKGANGFLASIQRICGVAERMLAKDERWTMRKGANADDVLNVVFTSVRDCEQEYRGWREDKQAGRDDVSPHPFGVIAEQLAAKTIATFGGAEAVQDLRKWTSRAEAKFVRGVDNDRR